MSDRLPHRYEALASELRAAAERSKTSTSRERRRSARRAIRRAPLLGVAIIAVAGTATAAVLTLQGEPSPPTVGELPTTPRLPNSVRYEISATPMMQVGSVGWCTSVKLRRSNSKHWFGVGAGCGRASRSGGDIGGATTFLGNGRGVLAYTIVDRTVAYALTSGPSPRRVLPISDRHLPNGWRAFVQLPRPVGAQRSVGGEPPPALGQAGRLRLRRADGTPLPRGGVDDVIKPLPTRAALGMVPADAPCTINPPQGARPRASRWLPSLRGAQGPPSPALLPCAMTRFTWHGSWVEATLLVDAGDPGEARPMELANLSRKPVAPNTPLEPVAPNTPLELPLVSMENPFLEAPRLPVGVPRDAESTLVRRGNAWLVIRSERSDVRKRALSAIKTQLSL